MNSNHWSAPTHMPFPFPPPSFPTIPPPVANQPYPQPQFHHWPPTVPPPPLPWSYLHQPHPPPWGTATDFRNNSLQPNITSDPAPPSIMVKTRTLKDVDDTWLRKFKLNCKYARCNQPDLHQSKAEVIKISDVKQLHGEAHTAMRNLEKWMESDIKDESLVNQLKDKLDKVLSVLGDERTVSSLANQVNKRMKKRARLKRKRHEMYIERKQMEERIKDKHVETDAWLEKGRRAEEILKREKQVQKELDNYLQEVRQKQAECKKSLELLTSLAKLRKTRKDSALRKGRQQPTEAHDEIFSSAYEAAREKLTKSRSICEEEEKKLRVFLVEEQKLEEKRMKKKEAEEEWTLKRWEVLFGSKGCLDVSDPMWPTEQLHKQANGSLLALAHTRKQWDQFVTESGSRVPSHWVEPANPSSMMWAEYCEGLTETVGD